MVQIFFSEKFPDNLLIGTFDICYQFLYSFTGIELHLPELCLLKLDFFITLYFLSLPLHFLFQKHVYF